jgi:hypothetical protein
MARNSSGAGEPQRKKKAMPRGKPFEKGDPRINRAGTLKPRSQRELETLLDEVFDEEVEAPPDLLKAGKTEKMTELRLLLKKMMRSKNIVGGIHVLDRRFGKVSDKIDLSNTDGTLKPEMPVEQIAQRVVQLEEIARQRKKKNGS